MSEQHFYADVTLPFHVWVREREGARGYRWVLRNTSDVARHDATGRPLEAANDGGSSPGPDLLAS